MEPAAVAVSPTTGRGGAAGTSASGGSGGSSGGAGGAAVASGGNGGAAGTPGSGVGGSGGAAGPPTDQSDSGCACSLGDKTGSSAPGALAFVLGLAWWSRIADAGVALRGRPVFASALNVSDRGGDTQLSASQAAMMRKHRSFSGRQP